MTTPPASSLAAWQTLAEKALAQAARTSASIGTPVAPLYQRTTVDGPRPWRGAADWSVSQRVDHPDAHEANQSALRDLEGGADALTLVFATSPFARGFGLPLDAKGLDAALADIELDFIGLRLDAGPGTAEAARLLGDLIQARRLTSASLAIDLGFDPIGCLARGTPSAPNDLATILAQSKAAGLAGRPLSVDGRVWHEAGAGEAQELAAVIATGVAYLRQLQAAGLSLDAARQAIAFQLALDADMFLGLAKTRAIRRLWARVEDACGLTPQPIRLHAETAWRMMTRRDPWVNVMRATVATSAAGLGGADVVTVLPFTLPLGLPDDYARRLARNVQRVLLDEAHLGKVEDPAAGAGGFDTLTETLCAEAWLAFQAIEREGGIEASLRSGALKARIAETATGRAERFATLREGIIGTNRFPNLEAPRVAVLDVPPRSAPTGADALPSVRDAAPFEALRDRADAMTAPPRVFLATLGPPAAFGARATYAANFFAAAGMAAVPPLAERDIEQIVSDFAASGLRVACLCGSDEAYDQHAADVAAALRRAGARRIVLAGKPGVHETIWRAAGLDAFCHDGCDVLGLLGDTLDAASNG